MSAFRIVYEGSDLWVPGVKDVLDPTVEIELNTAGRLTLTLPPDHPDFFSILPLRGTVEVYDGSSLIWFGRPVSLERNVRGEKPVYCEGALAYLNDSVQPPRPKGETTASAVLAALLAAHNAQVPAARQFAVGTVSVPATAFDWENDYEETLHSVQTLLRQAGGYLIPRRSGGTNYLDYVYELPLSSGQPVEYGRNLTDFNRTYSFEEKFTAVYPVGGVPEEETEPVTIADVNEGDPILDGDGVEIYGRIVRMLKLPEITDAAELLAVARRYLDGVDFDPISIRASAVDLSLLESGVSPFRAANQYHVISRAHDVDAWLPLTRLRIAMDKPVREISLGTASNPGVTELVREQDRQADYIKQSIAPAVGGRTWYSKAQVDVNPVTYQVVFMNGDTVLQTVTGVPKGGAAVYTGPTPTRGGREFTGWDKPLTNVQANLVVYAQFAADYTWTADPDWLASQAGTRLAHIVVYTTGSAVQHNRTYRKKNNGAAIVMLAYETFSGVSGTWLQPLVISDDPDAVTMTCEDTMHPGPPDTDDNLTYNRSFEWQGVTWYYCTKNGFVSTVEAAWSSDFPTGDPFSPVAVPGGLPDLMEEAGVTVTWADS